MLYDNWKFISFKYLLLSLILFCGQSVFAKNAQVNIENIDVNQQGLIIKFSGKTAFQTVQVDDSQILIALKGITIGSLKNDKIKESGLIKQISYDKMEGDVTALVVYTKQRVKSCNSKWLDNENSLSVSFVKS